MPRAPWPCAHIMETLRPRRLSLVGAAVVALALLGGPAQADTAITVKADQARVLPIRGEPATVIVGNPLLAEASVRPGLVVIHGRHYGTTNVVVLDSEGNELGSFEVTVVRAAAQNVTLIQAGAVASYSCAPSCETTLEIGDSAAHFEDVQKSITSRLGLSTAASKLAGE